MQDSPFPAPIFVLAAPGTPGATVAAALGRNPAAYDLPECNLELTGALDAMVREMAGLRSWQMHGLLRAISQLMGGEQTMAGVDMARRWINRHLHLTTTSVARLLAGQVAPRRMVMPISAALFETGAKTRLIATFPDAHYVHLQIHPRSHGLAVMAQAGGAAALILGAIDETVSPPLVDPQELWLMADQGIATFKAAVPESRFLSLRVEDLLADPDRCLKDLAKALGLPADATAVAAMRHPERSPFQGAGPYGANLAGDIAPLDDLRDRLPDPRDLSLAGAMPWRPDAAGLRPEVRGRAQGYGYT